MMMNALTLLKNLKLWVRNSNKAFKRNKNSWLRSASLHIIANNFCPLNAALCTLEMIFIFSEDHTLEILSSCIEAEAKFDAFDVECKVHVFFDGNGNYLKPTFIVPNKTVKKWLFFKTVILGKYKLKKSDYDKFNMPLDWAIGQAIKMHPNPFFETLEDATRYITRQSSTD